jgi:hypothetical protein
MQTLQLNKDFNQLVKSFAKIDKEFKDTFVNSFSEYLSDIHRSFPYFKKVGFTIRSYYNESTDSHESPCVEGVHYEVDISGILNTSIGYSNWYEKTMIPGNVNIFPNLTFLLKEKNNEPVFVDEEFYESLSSLKTSIISVIQQVACPLVNYMSLDDADIVFNCATKTIDYMEH